ncbi:tetratricopeptide repeat protein [Chondromyces crocatus]|uniref:Mucin and cadherin-like protein n=1 Tax=Chondromyces crocatus TaxID=52 RepID=A0A0K1EJV0_CHOCO|nr:hypothetical protein [Chondromyces crocatus]AKT40878.1 mucin and cadherin-like protein [Chondromyces crocatus]
MKLRVGASALLLSFVLPAALTELGQGSLPFAERESLAQQADAVTEVARQRYEDGVKAYDAGRFEDARAAFLQAYSLKRHPAVLLNLGQSELRAGYADDAGNHLQQFLREHKAVTPEQKAAAEKGINDAKRKAGFIIVIIDATGADVSIDGTVVGKSPLLDPVFVKPGKHTVAASYGGKSTSTQVDARPAAAAAANLVLGVAGAPTPAPVPVSRPATTPAPPPPSSSPTQEAAPPASTQPNANDASTASASGSFVLAPTSPKGDTGPGKREPILDWYKRKPIAWVGTGVAGVGLITGTVFSVLASDSSSAADAIAQQMSEHAVKNPGSTMGRTRGYCGSSGNPSGALPEFRTACAALQDRIDTYDTRYALAVTGWVVFGLGVVGTAAYAMIDWYPKKAPSTALIAPRVTSIAPLISPDQAGLGVGGTF